MRTWFFWGLCAVFMVGCQTQLAATATPQPQATLAGTATTVIFTGDDRTTMLRNHTAGWKTDWTIHTIAYDEIQSGGPPRDGIPSIDAPQFVTAGETAVWLKDNEPVVALEINGDARAYPLQILTWHEIVNDTVGETPVIVTFCPLCNSAIVFERRVNGDVVEFGTSGLLRNSDLIMYDRATESLWQQFTGEAIVGSAVGQQLTFLPSAIVSVADFRAAYPNGRYLSRETGFERDYGRNPYAGYDDINSSPFLYQGTVDGRLPAMARVVTVAQGETFIAYPLTLLTEKGVINDTEHQLVVFHTAGTSSALDSSQIADGADVGATGVFVPLVEGRSLTFARLADGQISDNETHSTWNIFGQAVAGELAGERLTAVVHADHFWFSWVAFRPETAVYQP